MSTHQTELYDEQNVGVRSRKDVEEAHHTLEASAAQPSRQTQISRGALAGYLWALGHGDTAPVTGAACEGVPDLPLLTAEADAAVVQLENATRRTVPRDYLHGVHAVLAWVCGHTDQRP